MARSSHLRHPGVEHRRQEWGTVGENDLRIDRADAEAIVDALNDDLSGLYLLFNQLRKHYWLLEGPEQGDLGEFLRDAADRLAETTDCLAIRVHALGGVPVCGPMGIRRHAPISIEDAHHYDVRSSLDRDLDGYATLAVLFREHVELAEGRGDAATGELLRERLVVLERDAHVIEKYLAEETLVRREALE
jgi:starvation-inducible DNA-binding protein